VNFIFSWLLCFGLGPIPSYGVDGIAWGTVIARGSGAVWLVVLLWQAGDGVIPEEVGAGGRAGRKMIREIVRIRMSELRPERDLIKRILRIGVPAAADGAISFSGH